MGNKKLNGLFGKQGKFHEEIKTRYKFDRNIAGKPLTLLDARILKDFNGIYGKHDAGLMLFQYTGKDKQGNDIDIKFTTIYSGVAIVDQLRKIIEANYFPVDVTVVINKPGMPNEYLSFEIPDGDDPADPDALGDPCETDCPF
jgi:hypothetical protein